ncbi:MAG: hypothetical protein OER22_04150 [Gammaproteobacteria bacterium]|nr:hypothetical protein [Gammaproteobacteria bacterium]MDH3410084.1 hypothetical protein [Gammaproteobacteria bacterium]MDH3551789.1 hypothetical protein [Gammaproteobacteria bacterium]
MAILAQGVKRYHLPARIRAKKVPENGFSCRLALADRIADLPGIHTVEKSSDTLPHGVDVYLQSPSRSLRKQRDPILLCSIGRDGVAVHGLSEWDKHQVLCGGWGKLERDHVLIFLPKDFEELEVCWGLLHRAYGSLSDASVHTPLARSATVGRLPRFSRMTHQ